MSEIAVQKGLDRLQSKRHYLESITWRLEDTHEAMEFYDFQDYIASFVEMWESVCRLKDFVEEHDLRCDNDHRVIFEKIDQTIAYVYKSGNEIIRETLPRFEKEFGSVKRADEFRQAVEEARILSAVFDKDLLEQTRTAVSDWK